MSNDSSEGKGETAGSGCHRIYGKEGRIVPGGGNEDAARDEEKGRKAAEALQEDGLRVRFHPLDVDDPERIRRLREFDEKGRIRAHRQRCEHDGVLDGDGGRRGGTVSRGGSRHRGLDRDP